jgi:hypothetical protein
MSNLVWFAIGVIVLILLVVFLVEHASFSVDLPW